MSFGRAKRRPLPGTPTVFDDITVFDGERFLEHLTLVVRGEVIASVEPAATAALPDDGVRIRGEKRTLLPGFIDCHVHLGLRRPRRVLRGGVTTARDLGWPLEAVRRLAASARGPRLLYAGPMLTAPGGYPSRAAWAPAGVAREVASPDEVRPTVAEIAAAGASIIKVAQDDRGPTLDEQTLRTIVDEARTHGLGVTSHVSSLEQLGRAIEAGVAELAHGLWSDEEIPGEMMAAMVRVGMTIVPTLHIADSDMRLANLRRFVEAGGHVVYGTDMGNPPVPAGIDVEELRAMARTGMTVEQVLGAATARASQHLGLSDRGRLRPGTLADLLLVKGDPREDLACLAKPLLVMRGGRTAR